MRRWFLCGWLTGFLIACFSVVLAQTTTLLGHVVDAATNKPMPFANVYLNGTTRGTVTDERGRYSLPNVPLGTVEVVASFVGYMPDKQALRLDSDQPKTVGFRLKVTGNNLADVTVKASRKDRQWLRQLKQFKQQLLGEPFGSQCLIANSYVINFIEENGHLRATATEPLLIENQALGYKLFYDLLYFDYENRKVYYGGTARFEETKSADERQAARFQRNRMRAYRGSLRHLMTTLVDSTYEREGFLVYQEDRSKPMRSGTTPPSLNTAIKQFKRLLPLRIDSLIRPGKLPFERRMVSVKPLVVFYTGASSAFSPYRDAPYAYSQLELPRLQMQFTTSGWITSPNGIEVQGSLADDRLSTLLPADWQPGDAKTGRDEVTDAPTIAIGQWLPPDARLNRIANAFTDRFKTLAPTVFTHIDKPFYATGDRLWLSTYLLDATTNRRPAGETAVHVDLLTPSGKLVQHQWFRVSDGRTAGNFRLSDSLASGTYRLRAYTDEDYGQHRPAFERSIAVYNLFSSRSKPVVETTQKPLDAQLLPEGGRWIASMPSRLGIKVVGPDGRGKRISGRIVNDVGAEIVRFATNELGMGSVVMSPLPDRNYHAEIQNNQRIQTVPLPPVERKGLTLGADVVSDSTRLTLSIANGDSLTADSVYVLIQHHGQLVEQRKLLLEKGLARLSLALRTLPPGLNQITLYNNIAQPQAERLVFVPDRLPTIRVLMGASKPRYKPRESVTLNMNLNDDGQPAVAVLSASVTDAGQIPEDTAGASIRTHLLLTGELHGRVEHPEVYMQNQTPETRRALDDLLLTQGWRRINGTPATELLGGVSVTGRVLDAKNQPLPGTQVVLASTTPGNSFVRSAGTDERGRFRLAGMAIADTMTLVAQLTDRQFKNLSPKDAHLVLDSPGLGSALTKWSVAGVDTIPDWATLDRQLEAARVRQEADADLYRDKTVTVLKEITVRARKQTERPEDIRRMSLHGEPDVTVIFDDVARQFSNLYDMIRGRLPGVTVRQAVSTATNPNGAGYQVIVRGTNSFGGSLQPLFLMDGMLVQGDEGTELLVFNPGDIDRVELLKNAGTAAMYGARGANGVIAFYSKHFRPDQPGSGLKTGSQPLKLIGYPSVTRDFYVPRYESQPEPDLTTRLDRRDVLYWKPLMQTDGEGRATLSFPLSDVVRTVRVTVQGITNEGRPVVSVQLIRVQ